ncbi:MAG: malate dehydrogenase [Magnetococcales bacterium]|nr:malate dehydrogenase [Magnetococcales bacterium]
MAEPIRVAVTGAAGQIAYSAIFRLASGAVFGPDQPVHLSFLEITPAMKVLEAVMMELDDSAFPTLVGMDASDQADQAFDGVNAALLIGSRPRGPGMERADLIRVNGPIFVGQGKALNRAAADLRVVVVGNPCNTNCLIAMRNSDVPKDRFSAMMRLDYNRAKTMLAKKANVPVTAVTNLAVWGNHSNNQYPDFENARIQGRPLSEVITDEDWLKNTFVPDVQTRGAVVIKARGSSSAASGAIAALDHLLSFRQPTPEGDWFVAAVLSEGQYGVDPGLIFGYPLRLKGDQWEVVDGLTLSDWGQAKFNKVLDELRQEREVVKDLL